MKRRIIFFYFYLILIVPCFGEGKGFTSNATVLKLINQGIQFHNTKDYPSAINAFLDAYNLEPTNPAVKENLSIAHNNYGKYLIDRTDYEKAQKEFRYAIFYDNENKIADENLDALLNKLGIKANDPYTRMKLGEKLRANGEFEHALIEYNKALSLSNSSGKPDQNIYIGIGDIYYILFLRDGENNSYINKSKEAYIKAIELKETVKAHIKMGDCLLATGDIISAIDHFKKSVELDPASEDALSANVRGWNEAVRAAPLVAENHIGLASALQLKREYANADEEYNQALKLDPENTVAQKGLESLSKAKENEKSIEIINSALKLQKEKKYDEAIQKYINAIEINPNNSDLHYNIGTAFQAKGDIERAEKAYNKSLEINSTNEKAKAALALISKQQGEEKINDLINRALELQESKNYPEAITAYLAVLSLKPDDDSLIYNLGTAYQLNGDLDNARIQYEKAISLNKENLNYTNALKLLKIQIAAPIIRSAINKQTSNDINGAIQDYLKALELSPEDAQTHFNLATAYQSNNNPDEAIKYYLKAIQIDPKNQSDAYFFLGGIYEDKKNNKQAIENFQKYIQAAPTGSYVSDAKERINYLKTVKS